MSEIILKANEIPIDLAEYFEPTEPGTSSVFTINTQPFRQAHFSVMPTKLVEPCILAGSRQGDVVLDPFAGAGTVLLVASHFSRSWLGIELNSDYVSLAKQRLSTVQPYLWEDSSVHLPPTTSK